MDPVILGLYSPYPQSGKSTFADALHSQFPKAKRLSFADPMREALVPLVAEVLPGGEGEALEWLSDHRKDTKLLPHLGVTLRYMMQTFGTEWGRKFIHPDLWVTVMAERIRKAPHGVIVDDVRMENEYAMLRKRGATMIKVLRKDAPQTTQHESNARLDNLMFDYVIDNDGDEEDLRFKALAVRWDMVS